MTQVLTVSCKLKVSQSQAAKLDATLDALSLRDANANKGGFATYDARIFSFRERDWTVSLTTVEGRERFELEIGRYQKGNCALVLRTANATGGCRKPAWRLSLRLASRTGLLCSLLEHNRLRATVRASGPEALSPRYRALAR